MYCLRLQQLGILGLALVLVLVSCTEPIMAATTPSREDRLATEATGDAGEAPRDEKGTGDRSADLGAQPVLLLDRAAKPTWSAQPRIVAYPLADTVGPAVPINTIPFQTEPLADGVQALMPRRLAGTLNLPHAPPIA